MNSSVDALNLFQQITGEEAPGPIGRAWLKYMGAKVAGLSIQFTDAFSDIAFSYAMCVTLVQQLPDEWDRFRALYRMGLIDGQN